MKKHPNTTDTVIIMLVRERLSVDFPCDVAKLQIEPDEPNKKLRRTKTANVVWYMQNRSSIFKRATTGKPKY